jgi:hypothetical protein
MQYTMKSALWLRSARAPVLFSLFSFLAVAQLTVCIVGLRLGSDGRADFRAIYTAAYLLRTGQAGRIYNHETEETTQKRIVSDSLTIPFNHLAIEAAIFSPLSFLSYRMAYFLFAGVNAIFLCAISILMRPSLPQMAAISELLPFAVFLFYLPVGFAIDQGQTQLLVLLLIALAFVAERRGQDFSAGIALGMTTIRLQIALPMVALLLTWKHWRMLKGFILSGSVVVMSSILLVGPRASLEYAHSLSSMTTGLEAGSQQNYFAVFPTTMPNLRGFILNAGVHGNQALFLIVFCSVGLLIWASKQRPSLALATTVALLVGYHNNIPDLALLAFPMALSFEKGSWISAGLVLVAPIFFGSLIAHGTLSFLAIPTIGLLSAFAETRIFRTSS